MTAITKRGLLTGTTALAAAAILPARRAAAQDMPAHERQLYEAAQKEGEMTWYTGQLQAQPSEAVGRAFTERYPGVRCNVVRTTSQVAFQRLSQDARARVAQCDVFSSTDYSHFTFLKGEGRLLAYRPQNAAGMVKAARDAADADGHFQISYLALYLLARRTDQLSEADAPKSWRELTDAKWKDKMAIGHPGFSGAIGNWAIMMKSMYGERFFREFERNKPQIGRSAGDPVTTLNAGERIVGVGIPSAATLFSISRGNPLQLLYPTDGTLLVPAPSAGIANAPHPNAAKLFMEFVCGAAYSRTVREFRAESLRPEVPPPVGSRPLDEIKTITPTPRQVETEMTEVKELWRDIFGV
ncbi:ABC transporter substrate-binding protein [Falsiroseomonas selenitidurans]|uniref:Extracellular solute-binding protein n=1 Tax=Falsiroseomonas selenitidurans TaxID=2716335 RepID=A0ABX1ECB3_9PROT|nr:extracellular solute-binding protein [Falsiroseomonas selenitidurans]NKC33522.1 extracellular solute-binding protein [Falsiroseomonas selenitidurans]